MLYCHCMFTGGLGITLAHICPGILHCLDLGNAQHLLGSVIFMLVWDGPFVGTLEQRIGMVWNEIRHSYQSLRTPVSEQLPYIKIMKLFHRSRSECPTKYPVLGSKGAQARHAVPALYDLCIRTVRHLVVFDHVILALEKLTEFYDIVTHVGLYLHWASQRAQDALDQYLVHDQWLPHNHMMRHRKLLFATEKCNHFPSPIAWFVSCSTPHKAGHIKTMTSWAILLI